MRVFQIQRRRLILSILQRSLRRRKKRSPVKTHLTLDKLSKIIIKGGGFRIPCSCPQRSEGKIKYTATDSPIISINLLFVTFLMRCIFLVIFVVIHVNKTSPKLHEIAALFFRCSVLSTMYICSINMGFYSDKAINFNKRRCLTK